MARFARTVSRLLCLLLILTAASSRTFSDERDEFPGCKGPGCNLIAEALPWPDRGKQGLPLRMGPYQLAIPIAPLSIELQPGLDLAIARYESGAVLAIHLRRMDEMTSNTNETLDRQNNSLNAGAFLDILFMKTPEDRGVTNQTDQLVWDLAMYSKGLYFAETDRAFTYTKGQSRVYAAPVRWGRFDHLIFISKMDNTSDFIEISSSGIPWSVLEGMIGLIH